jgi:hypothetical protein
MIPPDQLRSLDRDERAALLRELAAIQLPSRPATRGELRFRNAVRLIATTGAVVLVPWTAYLATTLPRREVTNHWRGAWVGFDLLVIAALATTAWFGWHRRQMVIVGLATSSVLLVCDAWFDVMLTQGPSRVVSVVSALLVELPLAYLFGRAVMNLVRANADLIWTLTGQTDDRPPLSRMPILNLVPQREGPDGAPRTG